MSAIAALSSSRAQSVWGTLTLVAVAAAGAIAVAMLAAIFVLGMHRADVVLLLQLLVVSAVVSLGIGGLFIRMSAGRRWGRLAAHLTAAHLVGAMVVLVNIVVTAVTMFISSHDLALLALLLGYSVAIALIFSALVSRSITSSLDVIQAGARRMAAGDLSARLDVGGTRELADVSVAFNMMAMRVEAAFARQRELEEMRQELIAAVSHDLRTPLASLRVMIEAIADGVADDPATIRRYLRAMQHEMVSLGHLVDDLFEMARLDAGQVTMRLAPNPIGTLVAETLDGMSAQAQRSGVHLGAELSDDLPPVLIDPDRIQRVLYNLVQNAIRHTPADGSVVVEAHERGPDIQVIVRDTGEGIAAADLPRVFEQFYRGDKARSRDAASTHGEAGEADAGAGAGLGLAIARKLVEIHGGRIWAEQPASGGTAFSFTLPKAEMS